MLSLFPEVKGSPSLGQGHPFVQFLDNFHPQKILVPPHADIVTDGSTDVQSRNCIHGESAKGTLFLGFTGVPPSPLRGLVKPGILSGNSICPFERLIVTRSWIDFAKTFRHACDFSLSPSHAPCLLFACTVQASERMTTYRKLSFGFRRVGENSILGDKFRPVYRFQKALCERLWALIRQFSLDMSKPIMPLFRIVIVIGIVPLLAGMQDQHSPSFEVATIKPVSTCASSTAVVLTPSGRLSVGCQSLTVLIRLAYLPRIQEGIVTGGPPWAQSNLYDLVAKVDEGDMAGWSEMSDSEQLKAVQPLLQHLLAERFKLRTHVDMRPTAAYVLLQAKVGAKLKEVAPPRGNHDANEDGPPAGGFRIVNNRLTARAVQIQNLLWFFAGRSGYDDAPTVDRTGLNGYYDFEMTLPDFKDKAEFGRQMDEQLGLRIEQQKVLLQTVVIDQAEKPTGDN